jgi:hypothetical protein
MSSIIDEKIDAEGCANGGSVDLAGRQAFQECL